MKSILIAFTLLLSTVSFSQVPKYEPGRDRKEHKHTSKIEKPWTISLSIGYIGITNPPIGSNAWGSGNLSYSFKNTSITGWAGGNYWVEGRAPDLRFGLTITQTLIKF